MTTKRKARPRPKAAPAVAIGKKKLRKRKRPAVWGSAFAHGKAIVNRAELRKLGIKPRAGTLSAEAVVGNLGATVVKFSAKESRILDRPVNTADVEVRPDGSIYLPHPVYTRRFNEAFGRGAWGIVPVSAPRRERGDVLCDYVLYIHGTRAAFATGRVEIENRSPREEREFFNGGPMTYGDALEGTVASGLRRCAKRLGIMLEMWDRKFIDSFLEQRCARVWRKSSRVPQYRLLAAPQFYDEQGPATAAEASMHQGPPAGHDGRGDEKISAKQVGRLVGICRRCGRTDDSVKAWLKKRYGLTSRKDIKRRDYDAIVSAIEANAALPMSREPGEEG